MDQEEKEASVPKTEADVSQGKREFTIKDSSPTSTEKILSVKGKDGRSINIPESMLSELRFKEKLDQSTVPEKIELGHLRTTSNRNRDFEGTLKQAQRAEMIQRAPLKKDLDKVSKLLKSLQEELADRHKVSDQAMADHQQFLKKLAKGDQEAMTVLSQQKNLMDILSKNGFAMNEYLQKLAKSTKAKDDFDMEEEAPSNKEYMQHQQDLINTIDHNEKDINRIWSELLAEQERIVRL